MCQRHGPKRAKVFAPLFSKSGCFPVASLCAKPDGGLNRHARRDHASGAVALDLGGVRCHDLVLLIQLPDGIRQPCLGTLQAGFGHGDGHLKIARVQLDEEFAGGERRVVEGDDADHGHSPEGIGRPEWP